MAFLHPTGESSPPTVYPDVAKSSYSNYWTFDSGFSTGTGVVHKLTLHTHTHTHTHPHTHDCSLHMRLRPKSTWRSQVVCSIIKTELYKWKSAVLRWVMDWNIPWPKIVSHIIPHEAFKRCFSTPGFVRIKMSPIRAAQTCAPGPKLAHHKVWFGPPDVISNKVI